MAVLAFTNHVVLGRVDRARNERDRKIEEGELTLGVRQKRFTSTQITWQQCLREEEPLTWL